MDDKFEVELPLLSPSHKLQSLPTTHTHNSHFINSIRKDPDPSRFRPVSWPSFLSFTDTFPLARFVNNKTEDVALSDLPLPHTNYNIERKVYFLDQHWLSEPNQDNRSIIKATAKAFKWEIVISFFLLIITCASHLSSTMLLGSIIEKITQYSLGQPLEFNEVLTMTVYFSILYFFAQFCETWIGYFDYILGAEMRLAIIGFIYKKLNSISMNSLREISTGKVINIIANDLNELDFGYGYVLPTLLSPLNILVSCYIMWSFFQWHTLISVICLGVFLIFAINLSNESEKPRTEKNAITDERVKSTNEVIECIRLIKQYAWEKAFLGIIQSLRLQETIALLKIADIEAVGRMITESSIYLCTLLTCIVYVFMGGVLTPEKVYTTMMILNFLKFWAILFFHFGRMFFVNLRVMTKRIHEILNLNDVLALEETSKESKSKRKSLRSSTEERRVIEFKDFTAYVTPNSQKPQLKKLNLSIPYHSLTAIIGRVGSGKSSFLSAFLKEMAWTFGDLKFSGTVAYVEQEPIIFSGTIRENITFGKEYNKELYKRTLKACSLDKDMLQMPKKDKTIVGEKGVTLSGGQKARLSLARALYSESDVYLLDDPLSAVDSKVAQHLFSYAIKEELKGKTVFLVTHHLNYAKEADNVILMNEGEVQFYGAFTDLQQLNIDIMKVFNEHSNENKSPDSPQKKEFNIRKESDRKFSIKSEEESKEEEETRPKEDSVRVTWETYKNYLQSSGNLTFMWGTIFTYIISQAFVVMFTRFLGHWATSQHTSDTNNQDFHNSPYIVTSVLLCICIMMTYYLKISFTIKFLTETNTKLHNQILFRLLRSVVSFFDITPAGQILNRFSGDLGILDTRNWEVIFDLLDGFIYVGFFFIYLCFINYIIIFPSLILIFFLYKVKIYFTKPSIELKRIDLASRSPIYSEITSTLSGLLIIRVYHQGSRFIRRFMDLIHSNSRAFLYNARTTRSFMVSLKLFLYILTVLGLYLFLLVAYYNSLDPAIFGLVLLYLLEIANKSVWAIRQTLFLDLNMQSAQRVLDYCNLPQEPPMNQETRENKVRIACQGKWPNKGEIEFKNVVFRYNKEAAPALKGISFVIPAKTKVGIVGRTGAGKSSIIQALFRMAEIDSLEDSWIKIDGVDIRTLGVQFIRNNLSIIPQTPTVFKGTIKRNLDPFENCHEEEIWDALENVGLKTVIEGFEEKLDTEVTDSSSLFSMGQKQLLCLSRALLKYNKIMVLDEATANVDIETEKMVQEALKENLKDCTVLTIAHRLSNIAGYDRVMVVDNGVVVEYDEPYKLLVLEEGDKGITNMQGFFAKMVLNSGEAVANEIFSVAYKKYYENV